METKATKKRRKHTEEFKREAVRLLENRGERAVADIAASLGVAENFVGAYVPVIGPSLKLTVALACLVFILLFKPDGLFGRPEVKRV